MLAERLDPRRVYDGHLIQMIGLGCWKRDDTPPHFGFLGDCGPLPTSGHHAPVMVLTSESDMVAFHPTALGLGKSAFFTRNTHNPNWRQYEMAGVSHIPEPIVPLGAAKPEQRGPAAAVPRRVQQSDAVDTRQAQQQAARVPLLQGRTSMRTMHSSRRLDADGHFAGGVRLPHVESEVQGRVAGAPLGNHTPLNDVGPDPVQRVRVPRRNVHALQGRGAPRSLSDAQRLYVKRVKRAADDLADKGYITDKDRKALIEAAEDEPLYDDDGND